MALRQALLFFLKRLAKRRFAASDFVKRCTTLNGWKRAMRFTNDGPARKAGPLRNKTRKALFHRIPIRIDLSHFANIELANTCLDLAHIAHHDPDQVIGLDEFFGQAVRLCRRE